MAGGPRNATITASAAAYADGTANVAVEDNDTAGVTVTPTSGLTTTEAEGPGHTATFTVVLTSKPTADVTIALSSSDTAEGTVEPASLTLTPENWDQPQTVTVTGVADGIVDGDQPYTIVLAPATSTDAGYDDADADDVSVTSLDSDTPSLAVVLDATVAEGGTLTGTVWRNTATTAALTVALASNDTTEATVPATVTIPIGENHVPFTLTAVEDGITDGTHNAVITATATGHAAGTDTVSVTDADSGAVDAVIRNQGAASYLGGGVINATAAGQTAAQNAAGDEARSYEVRVFNRKTAPYQLTLNASASAGGGTWSVKYFAGATDITAAITSAEGCTTTEAIDPGAAVDIRIEVKPATLVEADTVKTVAVVATTAGDAEASDTVAAATTKTGAASLATPLNLTATAGDAVVQLEWDAVEGATGYKLSRSLTGTDAWEEIAMPATVTYLDEDVTNGTTYYYRVIANAETIESAPSNVAHATPHGVGYLDLAIRNQKPEGLEEAYDDENAQDADGSDQTKTQNTVPGQKVVFEVKVANNFGRTDAYVLKAPAASGGWTVKFYKGLTEAAGNDITAAITSANGWNVPPALDAEAVCNLLMTLTPATTGTVDPSKQVLLKSVPKVGTPVNANTDAVIANSGMQSIGLMEWSIDGGDTWHPANGTGAETIPPVVQNTVVKFRVARGNTALPWPSLPKFKPEWTVMNNGSEPQTHLGDNIGVQFKQAGTQNITMTAECGNTVTAAVTSLVPDYLVEVYTEDDDDIFTTGGGDDGTTTVVALVTDPFGHPISGKSVHFTAVFEGGAAAGSFTADGVASIDATTDAQGYAQLTWTTGTSAGTATIRAAVTDPQNVHTVVSDPCAVVVQAP